MSWKITYHESRPEKPQTGDMWPAPWLIRSGEAVKFWTSQQYDAHHAGKRPPLVVRLPDGTEFCVDSPYRSERPNPNRDGWIVTGDAPNITLQPSINIVGHYHGWIQNGVITDDCEGRTFP